MLTPKLAFLAALLTALPAAAASEPPAPQRALMQPPPLATQPLVKQPAAKQPQTTQPMAKQPAQTLTRPQAPLAQPGQTKPRPAEARTPQRPGDRHPMPAVKPVPPSSAGGSQTLEIAPGMRDQIRNSALPSARIVRERPQIPEQVTLQLSGVHREGGSLVSQLEPGWYTLFGMGRLIALASHTPLSLDSLIPSEAATYKYYLIIKNQAEGGGPPNCHFSPGPGIVPRETVDRPDIEGDGDLGFGPWTGNRRQFRHIVVPRDPQVLLSYFARLCVVGRDPETGSIRAVGSNIVSFGINPGTRDRPPY